MSVPAPTPFSVAQYSTDSAGTFGGSPLVELLHDYFHAGSDDITDPNYVSSIVGFAVSIVVLAFIFLLILWCFNCCALCQCCRDKMSCCFNVFHENRTMGKITVIFIFFIAAITAMTSYVGRNEFNDAVFEIGDELRTIANIFEKISNSTSEISAQSETYNTATEAMVCQNASTIRQHLQVQCQTLEVLLIH
mmetsp:Transcript_15882/g.18734  ORF Transcript_15882/g.18734 Transcript_15882/m.18734 type:complete len:192 (+) Transcript_15882:53-628(+)